MNALNDRPVGLRHSAKKTAPVWFYCLAPEAQRLFLVGDFNHWLASDPMQRGKDGWWVLQVLLTHGHHRYQFLVDGEPRLDPRAVGVVRNEWNEPVSLISVS